MAKPQDLNIDYRSLIKSTSIAGSSKTAAPSGEVTKKMLSALTPTELAARFPDQHMKGSGTGSPGQRLASLGTSGVSGYSGGRTTGSGAPSITPRLGSGGSGGSGSGGSRGGTYTGGGRGSGRQKEPELTAEEKAGLNALRAGAISSDDPRVGFLKNIPDDKLKKMGITKASNEEGKTAYSMKPTTASSMSDEDVLKNMPSGKYRPKYELSDDDLTDDVINTIAGEAKLSDPKSVDGVINNMFNRLGVKGYASKNLRTIATEKHWNEKKGKWEKQYEGYRKASPEEAEMIRKRIREVASGSVPDNTNGANEFRAASYVYGEGAGRTFARLAESQGYNNQGGNIYARTGRTQPGPYAPYALNGREKQPWNNRADPPDENRKYTQEELDKRRKELDDEEHSGREKLAAQTLRSINSAEMGDLNKKIEFSNDNIQKNSENLSEYAKSKLKKFNSLAPPGTVLTSTHRPTDHPIEADKVRRGLRPGAHTRGSAIDIRTRDRSPEDLYKTIQALKKAGFTKILLEGDHIHAEANEGQKFSITNYPGNSKIDIEQAQKFASEVEHDIAVITPDTTKNTDKAGYEGPLDIYTQQTPVAQGGTKQENVTYAPPDALGPGRHPAAYGIFLDGARPKPPIQTAKLTSDDSSTDGTVKPSFEEIPEKATVKPPTTPSMSAPVEEFALGGSIENTDPTELRVEPTPISRDTGEKENLKILKKGSNIGVVSDQEKMTYDRGRNKVDITPKQRNYAEAFRERRYKESKEAEKTKEIQNQGQMISVPVKSNMDKISRDMLSHQEMTGSMARTMVRSTQFRDPGGAYSHGAALT